MRPPSVRLADISLTALHSLAIAQPLNHRVESSQANLSDPWEQNLSRQPYGAATPFNEFWQEQRVSLFCLYNFGWTGWTPWTGTDNLEGSRVQPRSLCPDRTDLAKITR